MAGNWNKPETQRRLQAHFRSWLGSWPEWGVIISLLLALEIAVFSIEQARWIRPQPSLTFILVLAVLTAWLLCRSRLPAIVKHPLAAVLGAALAVWQASSLLPSPEITSRISQLAVALQSWWQAASAAKPSEGSIHFAVFLILFTWIMGYISTWFTLRRQNVWVAVGSGGVAILTNLANLPEQHYAFFFFYTLAALLLLGMMTLLKHHYWFQEQAISYPNRGLIYFLAPLLSLSIVVTSIAWLTPQIRVERLETLITTKTLWVKNIEQQFSNLLAAIPAKQSSLKSGEQEELVFGDAYGLGDELQFVVISDRPYYWRSRMYDIYTSSGWASSNAQEQMLRLGISRPQDNGLTARRQISYTVVPKLRTDILLIGGEFISSDIPVSTQTIAPLSFTINLADATDDRSLPVDVAWLARSVRASQDADGEISLDKLWQLLPGELTLTDFSTTQYNLVEDEDTLELIPVSAYLSTVAVTRTEPASSDIVAVTSLYSLRPDRRYKVTTSVSSATAEDLSEAGDDYPYWVTDYYQQLPSTLPERVRQLSATVTRNAKTPYDKVLAIKRYLAQFTYTLEVKAPPQGADGVDYFLFTAKSGNCVHFASAMTVMLRSVGVPTRFSSGYSPGDWDAASGSSTLRTENRHTWPEVYFPGYGWVGFEATPAIESETEAILPGGSAIGGLGWLEDEEEELDAWVETLRWVKALTPEERQEWLELVGWGEEELAVWLDWLESLGWLEPPAAAGADETLAAGGVATISPNQWRITLLFAITGTMLLVYILWLLLSHYRQPLIRSDYASEVYRKMCFLASLVRLSPEPQQTPFEYYARLTAVFPLQAESFDYIIQAYVARRFSRSKELHHWQRERLKKSWKTVYPLFLKRLFHVRY